MNSCEFCGYDEGWVRNSPWDFIEHRGKDDIHYVVQCKVCGALGPESKTKEGAIEKWNGSLTSAQNLNDFNNMLDENMGGAAGGAAGTSIPGMGTAVPPGTQTGGKGSGDNWGNTIGMYTQAGTIKGNKKKKKKKKKYIKENLDETLLKGRAHDIFKPTPQEEILPKLKKLSKEELNYRIIDALLTKDKKLYNLLVLAGADKITINDIGTDTFIEHFADINESPMHLYLSRKKMKELFDYFKRGYKIKCIIWSEDDDWNDWVSSRKYLKKGWKEFSYEDNVDQTEYILIKPPTIKENKELEETANLNPYDKIGMGIAKKMGVKTPFKKKKSSKNQNAMKQHKFEHEIITLDNFLKENNN